MGLELSVLVLSGWRWGEGGVWIGVLCGLMGFSRRVRRGGLVGLVCLLRLGLRLVGSRLAYDTIGFVVYDEG